MIVLQIQLHSKLTISHATREWLNRHQTLLEIMCTIGGIKGPLSFVNCGLFGWDISNMGLSQYQQHQAVKHSLLMMMCLRYTPNIVIFLTWRSLKEGWAVFLRISLKLGVGTYTRMLVIWSMISFLSALVYLISQYSKQQLIYRMEMTSDKNDGYQDIRTVNTLTLGKAMSKGIGIKNKSLIIENLDYNYKNHDNSYTNICFNIVTDTPINEANNDFYNVKMTTTQQRKLINVLNNYKDLPIKCKDLKLTFVTYTRPNKIKCQRKKKKLLTAIQQNDFQGTKTFVDRSDCDLNVIDNHGNTCLITACKNNNLDVVNALLDKPQRLVTSTINWKNNDQNTALIVACRQNNTDIVQAILSREDIDVNIQDKQGNTPISIACMNKNHEIVEMLAEYHNCHVHLPNKQNQTPIYYTLWQSDINAEIFNTLMSHDGIKYDITESEYNETILYSLCMYNEWEYLTIICQKPWECNFNCQSRRVLVRILV